MIRQGISKFARRFGYDIVPWDANRHSELPPDLSAEDKQIILKAQPFTMTSVQRLAALIDAVRYISCNKIEGAIVECGVWRGGSIMAAMFTLLSLRDSGRDVFLYDTFEGMTEPTPADVSCQGTAASDQFQVAERAGESWCRAPLDDVKHNVHSTGYPPSRVRFIQGKVEDTIPANLPGPIALLRLDTDWYESTKHELRHLFPLLNPKGVLIVDDYGHWAGARKAVDEFFAERRRDFYFHRIDYTARLILRVNQ